MNAEENKRSIIVGVFVIVGMIILFAGIFIMGSKQNRFSKSVQVSTTFKNVSGLKAGNNIWFSGVKVGTVKKINFKGLEEVEVLLNIEEKSREYIRKNAYAKLGSDGFIGNKLIVIEGGSPEAPPVESGDVLMSSDQGGMDAMMKTIELSSENFVEITKDLRILLARLNAGEGTVGAALSDSVMADDVRMMVRNLTLTSQNSVKATQALLTLTDKLNKEGYLVNDLLTDTVMYASLKSSVEQINGMTQSANIMIQNLQEVTKKLDAKDNTVGLLLNDAGTADRIERIMKNLETSTEKLDQNMEALQHNFLFRGFFRRQAKENNQ